MTRPIAALAAFVLLAACWLGDAHAAEARHVRCAQHGELIDAPELAPHATDRPRLVAVELGGADAHCAIAVAQRHDRIASAIAPATASITVAVALHAAGARSHAFVITLFRIAPKTSPPDSRESC